MPSPFPLQQGDLDCMCSIYAAINLAHLDGRISTTEEAFHLFNKALRTSVLEGNIFRLVTQGIDVEPKDDMIWALRMAGFRKVRRVDWNENLPVSGSPGTVIFLRETDVPEKRAFTHFTIVTGKNRNNSLRLFDSCGISRLEGKPEERMLKCKARPTPIRVTIIAAWIMT